MDASIAIDRDIALLQAMIDGPDTGLAAHLIDRPYLTSVQDARADLADLIMRLEDVRAGRVVPQAEIVKDAEARRRRRTEAAE